MHEVELGVWKNLMVHLLQILASEDVNLLHTPDQWQVKELPNPMVGIASDFFGSASTLFQHLVGTPSGVSQETLQN
jgi:hypothetical protein